MEIPWRLFRGHPGQAPAPGRSWRRAGTAKRWPQPRKSVRTGRSPRCDSSGGHNGATTCHQQFMSDLMEVRVRADRTFCSFVSWFTSGPWATTGSSAIRDDPYMGAFVWEAKPGGLLGGGRGSLLAYLNKIYINVAFRRRFWGSVLWLPPGNQCYLVCGAAFSARWITKICAPSRFRSRPSIYSSLKAREYTHVMPHNRKD